MSIIVKGMKMPKNCTRCDYIGLNVAIGCPVMSGTNGRATDCPLVALPDKHGRLVDADALRDRLRSLADDGWNKSTTTSWAEAFSECEDMVDEAPTIEPRCETCESFNKTRLLIPQPERKMGKWIPVTNGRGGFECDQCHNYAPSYQDGVEWLSGFCPNCGCRMD